MRFDLYYYSRLAQLFYRGTEIWPPSLHKMYLQTDTQRGFNYPDNRLLPLQDVIKNGLTTRVTIGQTTGIFSHVREYFLNRTSQPFYGMVLTPLR